MQYQDRKLARNFQSGPTL